MKLMFHICVMYLCLYFNRQSHIFAKKSDISESSVSVDNLPDKDVEVGRGTRTKTKAAKRKKTTKKIRDSSNYFDGSESARFESEEIKHHLGEGEQFLDFSELAKMKNFKLYQDGEISAHSEAKNVLNDNPFLNWTCFPLSLEEEANISSGYLDKRIAHVIENAQDYPEEGTRLLLDMQKFYCYLKHVNQLVVDKVKRGKKLMRELVEVDPQFTQIRFDTDELTDHFSWITEEAEAFEKIMDGICYQWKCLIGRNKH